MAFLNENTLAMSAEITLAELLQNHSTSDEAISFISSVTKKMAHEYNQQDAKINDELEIILQRINLSIDMSTRMSAFRRISARRGNINQRQTPKPIRRSERTKKRRSSSS